MKKTLFILTTLFLLTCVPLFAQNNSKKANSLNSDLRNYVDKMSNQYVKPAQKTIDIKWAPSKDPNYKENISYCKSDVVTNTSPLYDNVPKPNSNAKGNIICLKNGRYIFKGKNLNYSLGFFYNNFEKKESNKTDLYAVILHTGTKYPIVNYKYRCKFKQTTANLDQIKIDFNENDNMVFKSNGKLKYIMIKKDYYYEKNDGTIVSPNYNLSKDYQIEAFYN